MKIQWSNLWTDLFSQRHQWSLFLKMEPWPSTGGEEHSNSQGFMSSRTTSSPPPSLASPPSAPSAKTSSGELQKSGPCYTPAVRKIIMLAGVNFNFHYSLNFLLNLKESISLNELWPIRKMSLPACLFLSNAASFIKMQLEGCHSENESLSSKIPTGRHVILQLWQQH